MKCTSCKHDGMEKSETTFFAALQDCYVIVEHVPCYKCPQCGETVFTASVSRHLDDILEQVEKFATKVSVVDYSKAA